MSGNKLLAENTIRRFMKLASVDTMTDNFISEMGAKYERKDLEEEVEETVTEEEETELSSELGSEEPEEEMEIDMGEPAMDAEPEMGAADMSLTEEEAQLLIDLGSRLAEAMGGEMDAEPAMDEPAEDDMAMDEPAEDDMAMDAPEEEEEELMQEALVNEVLKRVTKRIVAAKLKNRK
jgi:hypothetical protein